MPVTAGSPRILLSLLFAPGQRPRADDVARLAATSGAFAVSHRPDDSAGWLELLINGLTFDLHGLTPAARGETFDFAHRYGLPAQADPAALEPLTLAPGPHLAGGEALLPVVRGAAALAAALAALAGLEAVGWRPARALSGPEYFRAAIGEWLRGGAFPALGLTALIRDEHGVMTSEGLGFLSGQELRLKPGARDASAADARLAVRLIDHLVATGPVREPEVIEPLPGLHVELAPDPAGALVTAWRRPA